MSKNKTLDSTFYKLQTQTQQDICVWPDHQMRLDACFSGSTHLRYPLLSGRARAAFCALARRPSAEESGWTPTPRAAAAATNQTP